MVGLTVIFGSGVITGFNDMSSNAMSLPKPPMLLLRKKKSPWEVVAVKVKLNKSHCVGPVLSILPVVADATILPLASCSP